MGLALVTNKEEVPCSLFDQSLMSDKVNKLQIKIENTQNRRFTRDASKTTSAETRPRRRIQSLMVS